MDFDNESLLRCFISEEEEKDILSWWEGQEPRPEEYVPETGPRRRSDIFEYRLKEADVLREEGNELFKSGDYDGARQRYFAGIWQLDFDIGQQWNLMETHQLDLNTRKLKILSNICGAYLKGKDWVNTKRAADIGLRHMEKAALPDSESQAKFLYRKGIANLERGFAEEAFEALKKADFATPGDKQIRQALKEAGDLQKSEREKAKEVWRAKLLTEDEKACKGSWMDPKVASARVRVRFRNSWCCRRKVD
mmetsp:Transcript_37067/g.59691  ORF Transcript_37067/g.59691 Transcript_37067/m.59691 type:complete len:250 (+) Transcript_37067:103-852(+)